MSIQPSSTGELPAGGVTSPTRRRLTTFRVIALLTGAFFLMLSIPFLLSPWRLPGDVESPSFRWFSTVAGTADALGFGLILILVFRTHLTLLALNSLALSPAVAAVLILPTAPTFAVLLLFVAPVIISYPCWREMRDVRTWWAHPHRVLLALGVVLAAVVIPFDVAMVIRDFSDVDAAANVNWWSDYAEHTTDLVFPILVAATLRPGWRLIAALAAAAWVYLGLVAALVIPDATASWGRAGGACAVAVGVVLAICAARGASSRRPRFRGPSTVVGRS
jgi:hypothetical protein